MGFLTNTTAWRGNYARKRRHSDLSGVCSFFEIFEQEDDFLLGWALEADFSSHLQNQSNELLALDVACSVYINSVECNACEFS